MSSTTPMPTSFRLSPETRRQLDELAAQYKTRSTALTVAVDRLYNSKRSNMDSTDQVLAIAQGIYSEVFGALDDRRFEAAKVQEIYDWLQSGDGGEGRTVEDLAEEWREYDAEDVANNPA